MPLSGEYEPSSRPSTAKQVALYEASDGREGGLTHGLPVIMLTSVGAQSGKLRKNMLMKVEKDGVYVAVASIGGAPTNPAWYANLVANPLVEVQDYAHRGDYLAREVTGDEKKTWWALAAAAFPMYDTYQSKTSREIPLFVLEPVASA